MAAHRPDESEQNGQDDDHLEDVETRAATSELFWLEQRVPEVCEGQEHHERQEVNAHASHSSR